MENSVGSAVSPGASGAFGSPLGTPLPGSLRTDVVWVVLNGLQSSPTNGRLCSPGDPTVPLGRLATPEEIADVCLFFASPLASYVSGANLVVHGGGERPAFLEAAADAAKPR